MIAAMLRRFSRPSTKAAAEAKALREALDVSMLALARAVGVVSNPEVQRDPADMRRLASELGQAWQAADAVRVGGA